jgi:4-amino-4-deoxy-L-arabinose transferase-like glycosyltransferase
VLELGLFGRLGLPLPYFLHDPGNSLLMALAFRLFGSRDSVVALASGACFALLASITYLLGRRLFGPEAALLAGMLVSVNAQLLIYAGAGYSETPIAFFLTLLLFLVLWARSWRGYLLAGFVFGALVLLRANALPFLPAFLIFLASGAREGRGWGRLVLLARPVVPFLLGAGCLLVPNAVRTRLATGDTGFFLSSESLVHHTRAIPGKASNHFSEPPQRIDALEYALEHPDEMGEKIRWQLSRELWTLLRGGLLPRGDSLSPVVFFLFLFALLVPPRDESAERRRVRWLVAVLIGTALLVGATFHLRWRHLYAFLPIALLFAANELTPLLADRWAGRALAGGAVLLFAAVFGLGPILDMTDESKAESRTVRVGFYRTLGRFLAENTAEDAVVLLEVGGERFNPTGNALAWHSRRTLLQWSDHTLDSKATRETQRPVYALFVQPPSQDEERDSPSRMPAGQGIASHPGFRAVATFTHPRGTGVLYR